MKITKFILKNLIYSFLFFITIFFVSKPVYADNIVVVIDPGHGGESTGGTMDERVEREINLITSMSMKERLEQYDGVDVYLTRTNNEDPDMSRKERFEFAEYVKADFLFSVHYNMSENHTLYGSEVWVCSSGENYKKGASFAQIEIEALTNLGLFNRGIKCRLDEKGDEYYGILKYGKDFGIPSVIIEHCHLDEERDSAFWNEESYVKLGETDADSVAKYFKLKSSSLNKDYSDYNVPEVNTDSITPDKTAPEFCTIELINSDDNTATIKISSRDDDNYIQYYSYSIDNGNTWSRLEDWTNRDNESIEILIDLPEDKEGMLLVKVQNQYDLTTTSNMITLPKKIVLEDDSISEPNKEDFKEIYININNNDGPAKAFEIDSILILLFILVSGTIIITIGTFIFLLVDKD